jgi:hypothetical protein
LRRPLIAVLLAALAAPPAFAADTSREEKGEAARMSEDAERTPKQEKRTAERIGDDLASCKRDADGMRGPERSRFMTQCLRERK